MKISNKTDYALKTLLDLGIHYGEGAIPLSDIARRQVIPRKFLEQILMLLRSAGIVSSIRGTRGGYTLARLPSEITLASVVALTEQGLMNGRYPARDRGNATELLNEQPLREIWDEISQELWCKLESITIEDLCQRARDLSASRVLDYAI